MLDLAAAINIHIDPVLVDLGGFEITWHGFFTAVGIAAGVWLPLRLARGAGLKADDASSIAVAAVVSGIVGARLLWVFEHTDQIRNVGNIFALTDGGISVYGAMIGGVIGAFAYVSIFKRDFPKWIGLDVAAPGMILGQAIGRFGDLVNGEHFARQTDLPWAFRYTHRATDGPWAVFEDGEIAGPWRRGAGDVPGEMPVPVHPVAGAYEPILDFAILGLLLWMRRFRIGAGWAFIAYVLAYAAVRGTLSILRTDEAAALAGSLSVPQLTAIVTAGLALLAGAYLKYRPQPPAPNIAARRGDAPAPERSRRFGRGRAKRRQRRTGRRGGLGRG